MDGLLVCNVELSSKCQKSCFCCGRRKLERDYPALCDWGFMDSWVVDKIAQQLPDNIVVQFHSNGEPLLYPFLYTGLQKFKHTIRCLSTNAIALVEKADAIIDNLDTLTISVIEDDPLADKQYEDVKKFLEIKGDRKPFMIYRLLGDVTKRGTINQFVSNEEWKNRWYQLPGIVATRILHNSMGSYEYTKKVTIPEIGVCLDLLSHLVIDRYGDVFPCVRFDPTKINKLGNVKETALEELWNSKKRLDMIREHVKGNRKCSELCSKCDFYGVPTSSSS
jgi:radical SAM protein with 4Fe4S-binding SPASM domain